MHLFNFFHIVSHIFYKYNFYMKCETSHFTLRKIPFILSNLLQCLFFLFLLRLLVVSAMYCNLLFHLLVALCSFDNFLLLLRFCLQIFRSNPPVLNPNVFRSSCAINTYVLILPLFINGYPAVPQAGLPNLLSKCTQVGVKLCGSTQVHTP